GVVRAWRDLNRRHDRAAWHREMDASAPVRLRDNRLGDGAFLYAIEARYYPANHHGRNFFASVCPSNRAESAWRSVAFANGRARLRGCFRDRTWRSPLVCLFI